VCKEGSAFESKNANIVRQRFGTRLKAERFRVQADTAEKEANATANTALKAGIRKEKSREPETAGRTTEPSVSLTSQELEEIGDASVETVTEKQNATETNKRNETAASSEGKKTESKKPEKGDETERKSVEERPRGKESQSADPAAEKPPRGKDDKSADPAAPARTYIQPAKTGGGPEKATVKSQPATSTTAATAVAEKSTKSTNAPSAQKKSELDTKEEKVGDNKTKVKNAAGEKSKGEKDSASEAEIFSAPDQRVLEKNVESDVVDLRRSEFGEKLVTSSASPETRRYYRYSSYSSG
jgi:hypothetical protein